MFDIGLSIPIIFYKINNLEKFRAQELIWANIFLSIILNAVEVEDNQGKLMNEVLQHRRDVAVINVGFILLSLFDVLTFKRLDPVYKIIFKWLGLIN